ncbi:hypothetical protein ACH3VR_00015 [Microbacterium sp. B2969]|uniref:WxL domain-containing protein n=1 Tax=Microbacterium alkaliflavum TaxID=3248839 RepID=A0ABW7Q1M6_9MICO
MNKRAIIARTTAGALGGLLLLGAAGAAIADELGNGDVDVNVNIEALPPVGALTMSVAQDSTTLAEVASADADVRQFDGTLPTVTVSDDREEVPAGAYWYVTGQTSDFVGPGTAKITAGHLGWTPKLLTDGNGEVAEGDPIGTVLDAPTAEVPWNTGIGSGEDLLAIAPDSSTAQGEWKANAGLSLKTPKDVTPGAYSATLTLTLWEDTL